MTEQAEQVLLAFMRLDLDSQNDVFLEQIKFRQMGPGKREVLLAQVAQRASRRRIDQPHTQCQLCGTPGVDCE